MRIMAEGKFESFFCELHLWGGEEIGNEWTFTCAGGAEEASGNIVDNVLREFFLDEGKFWGDGVAIHVF